MASLFETHRGTLEAAVEATRRRDFWSPYPEVPSGKIYGAAARDEGLAAFEAGLERPFELPGHPGKGGRVGAEISPYGRALGITYPAAEVASLVAPAEAAPPAWAGATIETRVEICPEILARLNRASLTMADAVMHTTGQAFAMAFQAGGPHAQDRGLEAVADAWAAMTRTPASATWTKPQGKHSPIVLEKHWRVIPRGVALLIAAFVAGRFRTVMWRRPQAA